MFQGASVFVSIEQKENLMSKIICGANELEIAPYAGKTIAHVRQVAGPVLNIPQGYTVLLNDIAVTDENSVLRAGDELEFVKQAGEKGQA